MSPRQLNIILKAKVWFRGLFSPNNAMQLLLFAILFSKVSYNKVGGALNKGEAFVDTVWSTNRQAHTLQIEYSQHLVDQHEIDSIQNHKIDTLRNLIAKQP